MNRLSLFHNGVNLGVYSLEETSLYIGRSPECQIHIDQNEVSWLHAKVCRKEQSWAIEDLDSTNGTEVNQSASHLSLFV